MRTAFRFAAKLAATFLFSATFLARVEAAPTVSISMSPSAIATNATATLFMFISDDAFGTYTNGGISSFAYPAGVVNAASPIVYDGCLGSTTATPGAGSMSVSNISMPAFSSCFIEIAVTSSTAGIYPFTFPSGGMTASNGSNIASSSTSLTVVAPTVVTNTNDSGAGSLRQAILDTNSTCSGADSIVFNIPGAGPHTIQPASPLPDLMCGSLILDAYTQSGASRNTDTGGSNNANIMVALDGGPCGACNGLTVAASYVTISGFAMYNWAGPAIQVNGSAYVYGNYLGTDPGGMTALANSKGVNTNGGYSYIGSTSPGDRNLISANTNTGIMVWTSSAASIVNNQIGGRRDGSSGMGNGGAGVYFNGANYSRSYVEQNFIRYNGAQGVVQDDASFAAVIFTLNAMSGNAGIGIDINNDGPTVNDESGPPYDTDSGPNDLVNYPVITALTYSGSDTIVDGYIKTESFSDVQVQLFDNPSMPANTEGAVPLTSFSIVTDANGFATFSYTLTGYHASFVSAAATVDTCGDGCVVSSEYSPAVGAGAPIVSLLPTALSFAARTVGTTSPPQTITLANTGTVPLTIGSITISGDFAFTTACPPSLAASASCTIDVTFTPLVAGARTGMLTVNDDAAGSPHTVSLDGSGLSGAAAVADVSPSTLIFPTQPVGSDSVVEVVTVTNSGSAALTFVSIDVTGEFVVATLGSAATPAECPVTLGPGASCQIGVIFRPQGVNLRQGTLTVNSNASPAVVTLAGTGLVPAPQQLSMPDALDFGSQFVGTRSPGKPLAITNTSDFVASLTELSASGDFGVSDTCLTIAPHTTCSPLVTFLPTALGGRAGTLTVRTLRDAQPYRVALTGTGTANDRPVIELSVSQIGFGNTLLGLALTSQVVLKNVGLAPLVVSAIATSGDFFADTGCVVSISPGATCTVQVTFRTGIVGGHIGTLQVTSNASGSPHTVNLTGTGCYVPSMGHARFGVLFCGG